MGDFYIMSSRVPNNLKLVAKESNKAMALKLKRDYCKEYGYPTSEVYVLQRIG